jgi:trans-aconitate methyltransferase
MMSTDRSYFDQMYHEDQDPWGFETSAYERRKYALTVASLPKASYGTAFEPGCSIGVLTELLASRCEHLLATDFISSAVHVARRRLAGLPHVEVEQRAIPEQWPEGPLDLIVLSEIAYYFDQPDLEEIVALVLRSARAGAHVVGVHWRGVTDYPLSGDRVHDVLNATPQLTRLVHHMERDFVLDVWERGA